MPSKVISRVYFQFNRWIILSVLLETADKSKILLVCGFLLVCITRALPLLTKCHASKIFSLCIVSAKPLDQADIKRLCIFLSFFRINQFGKDLPFCRGIKAADHKVGNRGNKALGIRKTALSAADTGEVGGVIIGAARQFGVADGKGREQAVEVVTQMLCVNALLGKKGTEGG